MKPGTLTRWTSEDSAELYAIRNWGTGYFDVSENGHVVVHPHGHHNSFEIDLYDTVQELLQKNYSMPLLLRFSDILDCQIQMLHESFRKAIKESHYQGAYKAVYPIKVNQKNLVVQDIMEFGKRYHHGLEAGSKAELIAAVASIRDQESFLICNGYKDEEFIDLALQANMIGVQAIIVLEMPAELKLVLERARMLGVRPRLGIRAKLASRGGGHWESSGGDRSKFGLDSSQIIDVIDSLRHAGMLDCLELLHYHLGSQISDIRKIQTGLQEACRYYVNLAREGAAMSLLDIGGGLAVDYDGSKTNFSSSSNYSPMEYASDVVEIVMKACDESNIPHPTIISESGRATISHHSVLIFNVLDDRRFEPHKIPKKLADNSCQMLKNLMETRDSLTPRNAQEIYHDAVYYRDELRSMFLHGNISLREKALGESIFWHIIRRIANMSHNRKYIPEELEGLESAIADVYYCNFSLFQSLPDSWAIDQLFPIMPIHRLNEMPARQTILADITCDSDGIIDSFIDLHDVKKVIPLHELNTEEYFIGVFMVGSYQETLGDMHNLLGNINVIHIRTDEEGNLNFISEVPGDSVEEVLSYVEYKPKEVVKRIKTKINSAWKRGKISTADKNAIISAFNCGMKGYTYFEK